MEVPPRTKIETRPEDRESVQQLLKIYDFNPKILKDVLDENVLRSGEEAIGKGFSLENVKIVRGIQGLAQTIGEEIRIDIGKLEQYAQLARQLVDSVDSWSPEERDGALRAAMHYVVIEALAHEYSHVRSKMRVDGAQNFRHINFGYESSTYEISEDGPRLKEVLNEALNEAVTETFGREVYREYARRAGDSHYARMGEGIAKQLDQLLFEQLGKRTRGYENLVRTFDLLLEHAAKELEVPKEKVWEGFKQGYFAGLPGISAWIQAISGFLATEFPGMIRADGTVSEWDPEIFEAKLKKWEQDRPSENRTGPLFQKLFSADGAEEWILPYLPKL